MIKIGLLATLIGPYGVPGKDAVRGAKLALNEFGNKIAGEEIELHIESTNALPASATEAANRLLNKFDVDIVVGPVSGDEAVAIREIANQNPDKTFVNGVAGSQALYSPASNFFSFNCNGLQWVWGFGQYVYHTLGYKRIATVAEAYSFPFAQVASFAIDYGEAGGEIVHHAWCALGTSDYASLIDGIPDDVDAIFSTLGGTDGTHFIQQIRELRGDLPIAFGCIGGDQSLLATITDNPELLVGAYIASPVADDNPDIAWQTFVTQYRQIFGDEGFYSPSLFALGYYCNMKALLTALDEVNGNLALGQTLLQSALSNLTLDSPIGEIKLDRHRFAIHDMFINQIQVTDDGQLYTHLVEKVPGVDSVLGMSDEEYLALGEFNIHNIPTSRKGDTIKQMSEFEKRLAEFKKRKGDESD